MKWNNEGSFLNDRHKDLKADYVIANPPFNDSDWSGDLLRKDGRCEELGTPFSFAVLSTLLCFLQIFPFILFCLDSSTIYLSYPCTIFRSYRAGGAGRINWSDFSFDGVGQFYCPLTALHSSLPLLFSRSRLLLALRFAPALQIEPHDSALLSR